VVPTNAFSPVTTVIRYPPSMDFWNGTLHRLASGLRHLFAIPGQLLPPPNGCHCRRRAKFFPPTDSPARLPKPLRFVPRAGPNFRAECSSLHIPEVLEGELSHLVSLFRGVSIYQRVSLSSLPLLIVYSFSPPFRWCVSFLYFPDLRLSLAKK